MKLIASVLVGITLIAARPASGAEEKGKAQTQPAAPASAVSPPPTSPPPSAPPPPLPVLEPNFPANVPRITAGYQERGRDLITARNYVDFTYEKTRLQCDELRYNVATQDLDAAGNVILEQSGQRLAGDKFHFNLKTRHGIMYEASGTALPDLHFVAGQVEKYDEKKYRTDNADFTSCTQPNPRWEITGTHAELEVDNHVTLKNAIFKVKSVPVFYLPYMRYPIHQDDRATGFLIPNYGHSSQKGTILGEAFFWVINRSQDATIAYRSFSVVGKGLEAEYRYIFSSTSAGSMNLFRVFTPGSGSTTSGGAAAASGLTGTYFQMDHNQLLPFGITNQTDITILTSVALKSVYSNNFNRLSDPRKNSSTSFSKSIGYESFNVQLRRDETLDSSVRHVEWLNKKHTKYREWYTEDSYVSKTLPSLTYTHNQQKLGASPLLFSASGSMFGYANDSQSINTDTRTSTSKSLTPRITRFNWDPTISLPITTLPWITFNPSATYSGAYWSDSYLPATDTRGGGGLMRNTFVSSTSIYGPNFNRIFLTPGSSFSKKWKHSIEPRFDFYYSTKFDKVDLVPQRMGDNVGGGDVQKITFTLTNTLWGKRALAPGMEASPVDILRWELTQSYAPNLLVTYPLSKSYDRFSDLHSTVTFRISPTIDFTYVTKYDPTYKLFYTHQLSAYLTRQNMFSASAGLQLSKDFDTDLLSDVSLTTSGNVSFKSVGLSLGGDLAYSPKDTVNKLKNASLTVSQNFQCWGVSVMYTRYMPPQDQVAKADRHFESAFYFTLHIGSIGTISQRLGGPQF